MTSRKPETHLLIEVTIPTQSPDATQRTANEILIKVLEHRKVLKTVRFDVIRPESEDEESLSYEELVDADGLIGE